MLTEIDGTNGSGGVSRYFLLQGGSAPFREIWSEPYAPAVDHNTEARIFGHGATGGVEGVASGAKEATTTMFATAGRSPPTSPRGAEHIPIGPLGWTDSRLGTLTRGDNSARPLCARPKIAMQRDSMGTHETCSAQSERATTI